MSLYDELGGGDALQAALNRFYEKVLVDPPLAVFFEGHDVERIKARQKLFWSEALGGNFKYNGDLRASHQGTRDRGVNDELFDRFVGHFEDTLKEFGVPEEKIGQVMAITEKHRVDILGG